MLNTHVTHKIFHLFFTLVVLLFSFIRPSTLKADEESYQYNISITTLFQNEGPYLKEWIDYHSLIGVEHFYLYNHYSTDNYLEVLQPYIEEGRVECIDFFYPGYPQIKALTMGLEKAKGETKWLAIIDIDEFILPKRHENLTEFLKDYEVFGGVTINWQNFGTSNVSHIPPGELLIEHLTWKAHPLLKWNGYVKTIVRPERVKKIYNAHTHIYQDPYYSVRPNKAIQNSIAEFPIQTALIVINHYWTRDENFFYNVKFPRCEKIKNNWPPERLEKFKRQFNVVEDRFLIEKYGNQLKELYTK